MRISTEPATSYPGSSVSQGNEPGYEIAEPEQKRKEKRDEKTTGTTTAGKSVYLTELAMIRLDIYL